MQGGSWRPVVGESDPIHRPNEKLTVDWERPDGVPNVCVRFTLQGWKSDSNRPSLADIETT